jgi:hypothetical protein
LDYKRFYLPKLPFESFFMTTLTKAPSPADATAATTDTAATAKVLAVSRRHFTTSFAALAGTAGVLGLAACGGGGGDAAPAGTPAPAPAPAPGAAPAPAPGAAPAPGTGPVTAGGATFTLIAGQPNSVPQPFEQLNGTGAAAKLGVMRGLAVQNDGTMWVTDDNNHTIHRITPSGAVTTPYGKAKVKGLTNGVGETALLSDPQGICLDESSGAAILTIEQGAAGVLRTMNVTTLGTTSDIGKEGFLSGDYSDGLTTAKAIVPTCIVAGKPEAGKPVIWVADGGIFDTKNRIRKIYNGSITTVVSDTGTGYILEMVVNAAGELYVSALETLFANKIMKLTGSTLTLVAGGPPPAGAEVGSGDADGTGAAAVITAASGLSIDKTTGNMFVTSNGGFRQITPAGVVTTLVSFLDMIELGAAVSIDNMVCVGPKRFITQSQTQLHTLTLA